MNKIEKWIYPPIFSVFSYVCVAFLAFLIDTFFYEGFAGLGVIIIALMVWVWLIIPFYCIIYSKAIQNEKLKFLFAVYNSLVIIVSYMVPFFKEYDVYVYALLVFAWLLLWSVLPIVARSLSRKKEAATENEPIYMGNPLLQNKKKKIIAICFTCIYLLTLVINYDFLRFLAFQNFSYGWSVIPAALILIFLFSKNNGSRLEKCLLPVAFGATFFSYFISIISGFTSISYFVSEPSYIIRFLCSCLICAAVALMFVGTLSCFKRIKLLKFASLVCAVLKSITTITVFIQLPLQSLDILIPLASEVLFFIGIFVLATNKQTPKQML